MAAYKMSADLAQIIRTSDGLIIEKNLYPVAWAAFVEWVRAGNLPDPPDGFDAEGIAAANARLQLSTNDFKQVRTAINNASNLSALRPILLAMLLLIWRVAKANGLNTDSETN